MHEGAHSNFPRRETGLNLFQVNYPLTKRMSLLGGRKGSKEKIRKCSQLCPNLFADRKMIEPSRKRCVAFGISKIDWLEFILEDYSPRTCPPNHFQLPPSFERKLLLTFAFTRERFSEIASGCKSSAPSIPIPRTRVQTNAVVLLGKFSLYGLGWAKNCVQTSLEMKMFCCELNAWCSRKPHINSSQANPRPSITYNFNLTFKQSCIFDCLFISIYTGFDKSDAAVVCSVLACREPSGICLYALSLAQKADILTQQR